MYWRYVEFFMAGSYVYSKYTVLSHIIQEQNKNANLAILKRKLQYFQTLQMQGSALGFYMIS